MSLADEIRELRDRALEDLKSTHDYYTDTTIAWWIVHDAIRSRLAFQHEAQQCAP